MTSPAIRQPCRTSAMALAPASRITACALRNDFAAMSAESLRSGKRVEDEGHLEPIRGEGRARRPRELAWSSQAAAWRLGGRSSLASLCGEGRGGIFIAVAVPIWARPPGE